MKKSTVSSSGSGNRKGARPRWACKAYARKPKAGEAAASGSASSPRGGTHNKGDGGARLHKFGTVAPSPFQTGKIGYSNGSTPRNGAPGDVWEPWSDAEDDALLTLVAERGLRAWASIARVAVFAKNDRTRHSIRNRYCY